jgi:hypothetical protein
LKINEKMAVQGYGGRDVLLGASTEKIPDQQIGNKNDLKLRTPPQKRKKSDQSHGKATRRCLCC